MSGWRLWQPFGMSADGVVVIGGLGINPSGSASAAWLARLTESFRVRRRPFR